MAGETILIVEDDPAMMRGLKDNFEFVGYTVATATDGEQGLDTALNLKPDLILLDLMLPGINGYEICRLIRAEELDMPIIMLTAKNQESDIILGLNIGANDYVTKPFSIKELLARANAMLRNGRKPESQTFAFGECDLNLSSQTLSRDGETIPLLPYITGDFAKMPENASEEGWKELLAFGGKVQELLLEALRSALKEDLEKTIKPWKITVGGVVAWLSGHDTYHTAQIRSAGYKVPKMAWE